MFHQAQQTETGGATGGACLPPPPPGARVVLDPPVERRPLIVDRSRVVACWRETERHWRLA